jgi:hypothetical protein
MQTRTYGDLFSLITNMIGAVELAADEQTQVKNFINRRFQEAFDTSPVWPRYLVSSEERNISAILLSGATSSSGTDANTINSSYILAGVESGANGLAKTGSNIYYTSQSERSATLISAGAMMYRDASLSDTWRISMGGTIAVATDGTVSVASEGTNKYTSQVADIDNVQDVDFFAADSIANGGRPTAENKNLITYEQPNKNTIGDFNRIHRKDAFLNNSAIEYDFFADSDGANILNIVNTTDNTAFVTYKKQFTPFSVTSDFYNSTATVPAEFFNYMAHSVYADFLRVQNKQEEAIAEEGVAQKYIAQELEKVDLRMNNSTINKRFNTYVSRQSR